jgi:nicotinamidase-related amidase
MIKWAGVEILETMEELLDPKHTALIMWDFAERIVGNTFNADSLVANAEKLLASARRRNVRIIYSHQNNMHLIGDTGAPTIRLRMHRKNQPVSAIMEVPEPKGPFPKPELVESVRPHDGDIVFEKFTPNAFLGTCFEWWLKKYGIKTIVLGGVNIATGISGTAREAINRGYYAVVAKDCCGTQSQEDFDIAVASMERLFDVVTADDIIAVWDKG